MNSIDTDKFDYIGGEESPAPPQPLPTNSIDLLGVTAKAFDEMPVRERQRILFAAERTDNATNAAALTLRVIEHVHIRTLSTTSVRGATLNRRFNKLCKKYHVNLQAIIARHIESGALLMLRRRSLVSYASRAGFDQIEAQREAYGIANPEHVFRFTLEDILLNKAE